MRSFVHFVIHTCSLNGQNIGRYSTERIWSALLAGTNPPNHASLSQDICSFLKTAFFKSGLQLCVHVCVRAARGTAGGVHHVANMSTDTRTDKGIYHADPHCNNKWGAFKCAHEWQTYDLIHNVWRMKKARHNLYLPRGKTERICWYANSVVLWTATVPACWENSPSSCLPLNKLLYNGLAVTAECQYPSCVGAGRATVAAEGVNGVQMWRKQ